MHLTAEAARQMAARILERHGLTHEEAGIVADHLVEAELCGHTMAGLTRLVALTQVLDRAVRRPIRITREDRATILIDGGNNPGYVVVYRMMRLAVAKAKEAGVAVACAHETYYSGRNGYYVERAAQEGLVAMMANNATRAVAPFGGVDPIFGTNPLSFAFPAVDEPVVFDMGTGALNQGDLLLAAIRGKRLPPGLAVDPEGRPTDDPRAAMAGAVLPFGGAKAYGLSFAVQLLGILAGGDPLPVEARNWGHLFMAIDPARFMPLESFTAKAAQLIAAVKSSRRAEGFEEILIPGERSSRERRRRREAGFEVSDEVARALAAL